ncbi:hypothetical protein FRD01_12210 [Microvenator marinus]|jgi:hypothetical protein|uniref:Uncharacterized protein n=1 Tax=Microvenator marinus TaxID=2600177 RepID=A0A5B8XR17_9DELT|nr:hypothetical protein [Microvenator marinus]QED27985.1 hypothetical protein FRD01_12210 [Microvenator marinus]
MRHFHAVHKGLSLVLCDNAAVFEETFAQVDLSEIPHERVGARAMLVPATYIETIRSALYERGFFPRVIGPTEVDAPEEEENE